MKVVKKYGLEISQPGITSERGITYEMTGKKDNVEVHWYNTVKPLTINKPRLKQKDYYTLFGYLLPKEHICRRVTTDMNKCANSSMPPCAG